MIEIGQSASRSMIITEQSVGLFVELSGDTNPIHTDEVYAQSTRFGHRIAPGMQVAAIFSAILANDLPGPGTIYLEQNLNFLAPVYIGDRVHATVEVIELPRPGRARLDTKCMNDVGVIVISGSALVKCP